MRVSERSFPELDAGRQSAPRFEAGNDVRRSHGGYASSWKLAPRAAEIAEGLRAIAPDASASNEPTLLILAGQLARLESVSLWLDEHGLFDARNRVRPAVKLLTGLEASALRAADSLGLNSRSRVALGLDAAQGTALSRYLEERYGQKDEPVGELSNGGGDRG